MSLCPATPEGTDAHVKDLNHVVDRFGLRSHLTLSTKVISATWDEPAELWEVEFQNVLTKHTYTRSFRVVVSACGIFANPKLPKIEGIEKFQGASWHTGKWDWSYDITNKRVAVIGNGCSGCQVIPAIAPKVKHLTHLARSKQWLFARVGPRSRMLYEQALTYAQPNQPYSSFAIWMFRAFPGWMRWTRFWLYYNVDELYLEYVKNPKAEGLRAISEKEAREYMVQKTPKKYLKQIMPEFPVGCKRRVMDPGYLDALHRSNVDLCSEKIAAIDETGVQLANGEHVDADVIIYATGFQTQEYLAPMRITGQGGKTLTEHWKDTNGCQAYLGTSVSGFPNFAIMFGPNASPVHNSVIYVLEVQASYIAQTFFEPLLTGRAKTVAVKRTAEDLDCQGIQEKLLDGVWHQGCTNWTLNENGRNCTNFPGYVRSFWWKLYWPKFQDYILTVRDLIIRVSRDSADIF